jgi:hypothetical protein
MKRTKKAGEGPELPTIPHERPKYLVRQITLKEALLGTGSKNLYQLEEYINEISDRGYRLHSFSTASANSTGPLGGDRIQATMVFERID